MGHYASHVFPLTHISAQTSHPSVCLSQLNHNALCLLLVVFSGEEEDRGASSR